jgi:tetratricopeptide (TPR) repeat protein
MAATICIGLPALAPFALSTARAVTDFGDAQALDADVLPGDAQKSAPDLQLQGLAAAKANALAAFTQAIIAEDNGDSDSALAQYKKALALDPGYTELAVKVAYELARRGDPSGGVEVLKDSIQASPKAPLAYLYLSQIYAKYLDKPELGQKYALTALDLDPGNIANYIAAYEIDTDLIQPAKASALLDRAIKQTTPDPQFWLQLGDFYIKSLGATAPSKQDIAKLNNIYGRALVLDSNNPITLARVGDYYTHSGQEAEAIPVFLKAIKLSPANAEDGDDTLENIRNNLAICYDSVGKTPEAIATLQQLIKENPLRYEAYETLCDLYEKSNDIEAALGVSKQMMLLDPTKYRNYMRSAALLMKEKKPDAAIQMLTDARVKFPSEAEISYALGIAYSEAKRYQEAVSVFDQAMQDASTGETEMLDAQFYYAYGSAEEELGDVDKATTLLKKAIDLDPDDAAEAYNDIGFMWVDKGIKLDEAGTYIKKALQMDPNNAAYLDSLGWYYYKKGQYQQALDLLKKAAAAIQPEDGTVDEHVGDAYAALNDTPNALKYWQRASDIDKDNKEITVKIAGAKQKLARQAPPGATPAGAQ